MLPSVPAQHRLTVNGEACSNRDKRRTTMMCITVLEQVGEHKNEACIEAKLLPTNKPTTQPSQLTVPVQLQQPSQVRILLLQSVQLDVPLQRSVKDRVLR